MSYAFRETIRREVNRSFSHIIEYSDFSILINVQNTEVETCSKNLQRK